MASGLSNSQKEWSTTASVRCQMPELHQSLGELRRLPSDVDSWVEISSRPSTSSLSSVADDGPQSRDAQSSTLPLQRRRLRQLNVHGSSLRHASSREDLRDADEEEYESETDGRVAHECEDDMLEFQEIGMEEASRVNVVTRNQSSSQEAYMEEETFTPRLSVFTPQPNAFSEALSQNREGNSISYFARKRSVDQGPLPPTDHALEEARLARTDGAILEDKAAHEAIMKQSLDTLLSCAAAAKALARNPPSNFHPSFSVTHRQLGSERDLAAADTAKVSGAPRSMTPSEYCTKSRAASSMANSFVLEEPSKYTKTKRRASQRTGSRERASKKTKSQPGHVEDLLYPTLMTWAMGAGIVVLVSAISFSAGYAIGVEVGQAEVLSRASDGAAHGVTCGQEVMKGGLRRLRWSSTAARFSSAA